MINPIDMLKYGIHEGCIFNLAYEGIVLSNEIFQRIDKNVPMEKTFSKPNPENNYYKVMEEVPPFYQYTGNSPAEGFLIDSKNWFEWYINFYYHKRTEHDDIMIQWWDQVILWGLYTGPKTPAVDQMLLHYSWNPGFDFKTRHKHG